MNKLNQDIIRLISNNLDFKDILDFSITNKFCYYSIDELFYKKIAKQYYGEEFWNRANKRPWYYSKPLKNTKQELIRIENFQKNLDSLNVKRWTQKDFYDYWEGNDRMTNKIIYSMLNIL